MTRLFQYATSSDPGVLDAIRARDAATRDLHRRAVAFAARYGSTDGAYFRDDFGGTARVTAIDGDKPVDHGQWKKGRRGWIPYKNNPIRPAFNKLVATSVDIPGVPTFLYGRPNADGSQAMYSPHPFVFDDAAWVGTAGAPIAMGHDDGYGPQWQETLASQFHLALEGHNAARKRTRTS